MRQQVTDGLFYLVGFDEDGEMEGARGAKRLVCNIEGGGKLAIWGSEWNRANIDAVLAAGLPCIVRCACAEPQPWGEEYGHTHWVPQHVRLEAFKRVDIATTSKPA